MACRDRSRATRSMRTVGETAEDGVEYEDADDDEKEGAAEGDANALGDAALDGPPAPVEAVAVIERGGEAIAVDACVCVGVWPGRWVGFRVPGVGVMHPSARIWCSSAGPSSTSIINCRNAANPIPRSAPMSVPVSVPPEPEIEWFCEGGGHEAEPIAVGDTTGIGDGEWDGCSGTDDCSSGGRNGGDSEATMLMPALDCSASSVAWLRSNRARSSAASCWRSHAVRWDEADAAVEAPGSGDCMPHVVDADDDDDDEGGLSKRTVPGLCAGDDADEDDDAKAGCGDGSAAPAGRNEPSARRAASRPVGDKRESRTADAAAVAVAAAGDSGAEDDDEVRSCVGDASGGGGGAEEDCDARPA